MALNGLLGYTLVSLAAFEYLHTQSPDIYIDIDYGHIPSYTLASSPGRPSYARNYIRPSNRKAEGVHRIFWRVNGVRVDTFFSSNNC